MADDTLTFEGFRLHAFQRHGSKWPWFALPEVCEVLGYRPTATAELADRLDVDEKGYANIVTPGGSQQVLIVSLSGLTRITATSYKPIAKRFNKWLHGDVVTGRELPSDLEVLCCRCHHSADRIRAAGRRRFSRTVRNCPAQLSLF